MKTKLRVHPEWLSTTLTRFRNWVEIGFKIHIYPDGSYEGERNSDFTTFVRGDTK